MILWSFLSGSQAIPAAISWLRSMGILFASGSLRIASVLHRFLYVMVNIISSQAPCGPIGNYYEQNCTSTIQNRSLKAQTIEQHATQAGKGIRTEGGCDNMLIKAPAGVFERSPLRSGSG